MTGLGMHGKGMGRALGRIVDDGLVKMVLWKPLVGTRELTRYAKVCFFHSRRMASRFK